MSIKNFTVDIISSLMFAFDEDRIEPVDSTQSTTIYLVDGEKNIEDIKNEYVTNLCSIVESMNYPQTKAENLLSLINKDTITTEGSQSEDLVHVLRINRDLFDIDELEQLRIAIRKNLKVDGLTLDPKIDLTMERVDSFLPYYSGRPMGIDIIKMDYGNIVRIYENGKLIENENIVEDTKDALALYHDLRARSLVLARVADKIKTRLVSELNVDSDTIPEAGLDDHTDPKNIEKLFNYTTEIENDIHNITNVRVDNFVNMVKEVTIENKREKGDERTFDEMNQYFEDNLKKFMPIITSPWLRPQEAISLIDRELALVYQLEEMKDVSNFNEVSINCLKEAIKNVYFTDSEQTRNLFDYAWGIDENKWKHDLAHSQGFEKSTKGYKALRKEFKTYFESAFEQFLQLYRSDMDGMISDKYKEIVLSQEFKKSVAHTFDEIIEDYLYEGYLAGFNFNVKRNPTSGHYTNCLNKFMIERVVRVIQNHGVNDLVNELNQEKQGE